MILMNIKPNIWNFVHKVTFGLFAFTITLSCFQFVIQFTNHKHASQEQQNFVIMKHLVSLIRISLKLTDLFFYEGVSSHGSRYHYQASGHDSRVFIEILLYKQCMVLSEIIKNYWQCMVFKNGCSNNKDQSNRPSL